MMFFKTTYFDIKNFLRQEWKKLLVVPLGFLLLCFTFYLKYVKNTMPQNISGSFGDYWLYIFGGMKEYIPSPLESFKFPVFWMVLFLYLFYVTLYYPYNDLLGYGQNVLVRSRGRFNWWLSKCMWNAFTVLSFFLIGVVTVALFCAITSGVFSVKISPNMYTEVFSLGEGGILFEPVPPKYPAYITGALIGLPILTAIAISQLQMLVSLWLRPIFSFCVTAAVLVASAYYVSPFMIGNYAIPIRCDAVISNGVSPVTGVITLSVIIIVCIIVGGIAFKHYDIINKEN